MENTAKLLLVEDNSDIREVFAMILGSFGYNVVQCGDGNSAVERANEYTPDIAIIDVGLPDIDGYQVAEQIRSMTEINSEYCPILVALTGQDGAPSHSQAKKAGFDLHFSKPVELKKVHAEIESFRNKLLSNEAA